MELAPDGTSTTVLHPSLIFYPQWRSWLWNTIEYPWTSSLAQFLAFFSLFMVGATVVGDWLGVFDLSISHIYLYVLYIY